MNLFPINSCSFSLLRDHRTERKLKGRSTRNADQAQRPESPFPLRLPQEEPHADETVRAGLHHLGHRLREGRPQERHQGASLRGEVFLSECLSTISDIIFCRQEVYQHILKHIEQKKQTKVKQPTVPVDMMVLNHPKKMVPPKEVPEVRVTYLRKI